MKNKSILFVLAICAGMQCGVSFGMLYQSMLQSRSSRVSPKVSPKVAKRSIWYVFGPNDSLEGEISKSEAIRLVKADINKQLRNELQYPTPLSKVRVLQEKISLLPGGLDYNDQLFTQACDELIKEIDNASKQQSEVRQAKDKAIDLAIAKFNQQFVGSADKFQTAIEALLFRLTSDARALISIALQEEWRWADVEMFGKEKYSAMMEESKVRVPMNEERKQAFEIRKKELAEKLQNARQKKQQMENETKARFDRE